MNCSMRCRRFKEATKTSEVQKLVSYGSYRATEPTELKKVQRAIEATELKKVQSWRRAMKATELQKLQSYSSYKV